MRRRPSAPQSEPGSGGNRELVTRWKPKKLAASQSRAETEHKDQETAGWGARRDMSPKIWSAGSLVGVLSLLIGDKGRRTSRVDRLRPDCHPVLGSSPASKPRSHPGPGSERKPREGAQGPGKNTGQSRAGKENPQPRTTIRPFHISVSLARFWCRRPL